MGDRISRFRRFQRQAGAWWDESAFLSHEELSRLHKFASFCVLAVKSFNRNRCPVRAAALAYATLLALIPMLAVVMSITTSFLKESGVESIDHFIVKFVASITPRAMVHPDAAQQKPPAPEQNQTAPQTSETGEAAQSPPAETEQNKLPAFAQKQEAITARKEIAHRIHEFIQNTQSGALGITGAVGLIFAAISMLGQMESTFNDIWGVQRGRSWFTRVVLYWAMISLAPLLLAVSLGLTTGPHLVAARTVVMKMPFLGRLIFELLPVLVLCVTFAVLYEVMPNTKVHLGAALVGGLVAGTLWHLNSLLNVLYVSRVVSNFRIYGSLGLVPVFMIGLYLAWLIVLFGAQVAYAVQNRATYLEEKRIETINDRERELVALRLMARVAQRFQQGNLPPTVLQLGQELAVPSRLIQQLVHRLCATRLVVETTLPEPAYLPARSLERITCEDILVAIRAGRSAGAKPDATAHGGVIAEFARIEHAESEAASAITLQALASRVRSGRIESKSTEPLAGADAKKPQLPSAEKSFYE
jgi:membrane protein